MMRYTFQIPAEPDELFAPSAAERMIGQTPKLNVRPSEGWPVAAGLGRARVVAASVIDGGRALSLTVSTEALPLIESGMTVEQATAMDPTTDQERMEYLADRMRMMEADG